MGDGGMSAIIGMIVGITIGWLLWWRPQPKPFYYSPIANTQPPIGIADPPEADDE
jgi:hypothetical protein